MNKNLVRISKFLSLVLRHKPETIGMELDDGGWLDIASLLENANANAKGTKITLDQLHEAVATNDKKRFALSEDGLRIRANQGHSVPDVRLDLKPVEPPEELYHGTVNQFLPSILEQGLTKRSRNHVHLSDNLETATKVAQRRGKAIILKVASKKMHDAGYEFYLSENKVWLTDAVPPEFIEFP